jgi:hypothetical protein
MALDIQAFKTAIEEAKEARSTAFNKYNVLSSEASAARGVLQEKEVQADAEHDRIINDFVAELEADANDDPKLPTF